MSKKTFTKWEEQKRLIIVGANKTMRKKVLTEAEFDGILAKHNSLAVNHADRKEFLKNNGYEVNRKNMVNALLSASENNELGL